MTVVEPVHRRNDVIGVDGRFGATVYDRLLHDLHRVVGQQLQDANVLPGPGHGAVTPLEVGPQLLEAGRQRPAVEHEGVIQGRRPATEDGQIVAGFNDPFASCVATPVTGDHHVGSHDLDPIHVTLDGHRREGPATRHTVAIGVEPHGLVLVDLRRSRDKRIKGMGRQSQRRLLVLFEQLPHGLRLACHAVIPLGQSALSQIRIELG